MCTWSTSNSGRFTPGREHKCSLNGELGGPQRPSARLGEEEKNLLYLLGFELRTAQTVAWTDRSSVL